MAIDQDILKALKDLTSQLKSGGSRSGRGSSGQQGGSDLDSLMGEALGTEEAERLNRELEIAKTSARDMRDFRREEARIMGEINDSASALRAKRESEVEQAKIALKTAEDTLDNEQATLDYLQQQLDIDAERLGVAVELLAANDADFQAAQERVRLALEHRNAQSGVTKELHKSKGAAEELEDATESVLNQMGLSGKGWENSFFGKLEKLGASKTFQTMGTQIASALKPANLVGAGMTQLVQASVQAVGERDRNIASFNKATGAGGKYNQVIEQTYKRTDGLAIAHEDAAAAVSDLAMGFGGFSKLTGQTQADLGQLVAGFENLGVSGTESVQFLDTAVKGLGMSAPQAAEELKKTALAADALGIPVARFTSDLAATMPKLAAFGQRAPEVFRKTAAVADKLGLSTSELVGAMDQFTTFRGAAESAGKLNAMLGGTINSMELVAASAKGPDEALKVLRKGVNASGKSFQDLGVFGKKAIADSIGVDAQTAAKLFSGEIGSVEDAQKAALAATKDKADMDKKLKEMMEKAIPIAEQFAEMFKQMAPLITPIIQLLRAVVTPLLGLVQALGDAAIAIPIVVGAFLLWAKITGVMKGVSAANVMLTTTTGKTALIIGGLAAAFGLLYYFLAVKSNSPVLYLLLPIVALGMAAMSSASVPLAAGLKALAAGFAAVIVPFGTFALIAGGLILTLTALTLGLTLMFESINLEKMIAFGVFVGALVLGAPFMLAAALGLGAMALGVAALGLALKTTSTDDLQALATMMGSEGQGVDKLIKLPSALRGSLGAIEDVSSALVELNQVMASMNASSAMAGISIGYIFESLGDLGDLGPDASEVIKQTTNMVNAVTTLDSAAVEQAEALLDHAAQFMDSASGAAGTGATTGILEKLASMFSGEKSSGSTAASSNSRQVVLAMDSEGRKIMARGIINDIMPLLNKKLDTRIN